MKRLVPLSVLVLAVATAAGVALAASSGGPGHGKGHGSPIRHGKVIHVVEHATTDAVTNHADGAVDSVGDVLTFTNDVFDKNDSTKVGSDQGYCVRIVVGQSWECVWTTFLDRGQITVEGPFYDTKDSVLAVTGGTGAYSFARGWMELKSRAGGTEFDFIFHLSP
jgi:Allene oxide cyclase